VSQVVVELYIITFCAALLLTRLS